MRTTRCSLSGGEEKAPPTEFKSDLMKLLFASLIPGSLSTISAWLLRVSSGNISSLSLSSSAVHKLQIKPTSVKSSV